MKFASRTPSLVRTMFRGAISWAICCWLASFAIIHADDRFALEVRDDPSLNSTAVLEGSVLTITDSQGQQFRYERSNQLDSADGNHLGYATRGNRQQLRWPRTGSGAMYIRDPLTGNWRASRQRVRTVSQPQTTPSQPQGRQLPQAPVPGGRQNPNQATNEVRLTFRNKSKRPVDIALVDQATGRENFFFRLNAGGVVKSQVTNVNDQWVARTNDRAIASEIFVPNQQTSNWTIGPPLTYGVWESREGDRIESESTIATVPVVRLENRLINGRLQSVEVESNEERFITTWTYTRRDGTVLGRFREEERTDTWIGLYEPDQQTWVRLYEGEAYFDDPQSNGWEQLALGSFVKRRPAVARVPRLESSEIVPNESLPPVAVSLQNSQTDELVVQVVDRRDGKQRTNLTIPPRGSEKVTLNRDAGATLVEVYSIPLPGGAWKERTIRREIPPRVLYDVVVFTKKTTYEFKNTLNPKQAGAAKSFSLKGLTSVGLFEISPGAALVDAQRIDAFQQAKAQQNAGAAGFFAAP